MAQKKKETTIKKAKTTTKKTTTTRKTTTTTTTSKRGRKSKEIIIQQTLPFYGSDQAIGHQYNKNKVAFAPQQHETATDNIVGELVGRLISKIDNEGTKQTQEYSKEIQPVNNNNNSNVVNIYNDGNKKEEKQPDETPKETPNDGRSAGEDFALQSGASAVGGAVGLLGVGGLGVAYNSEAATKAKLKFKKAGTGILGAVTSGVGAVGSVINNNVLKRGNKLGGEAGVSNLTKEGGKIYEKKGKSGYQNLIDEPNPLQHDFDKFIGEATPTPTPKRNKQTIEPKPPTPSSIQPANTPTPTPIKRPSETVSRMSIFTPARSLASLRPQNILTPSINLSLTPKTIYSEPVETTLRKMNASDRIKAAVKRRTVQKDMQDVNKEAAKIQRAYKKSKTKARPSLIQQHDGVSTRAIRAQTEEPHSEIPRQYFMSDHPEYRRGQRARENDGARFRPLVEVLNPDNPYNQGYFGDALKKGKEGYHTREVKRGRSTGVSQADTQPALTPRAAIRAVTAPTPKKK